MKVNVNAPVLGRISGFKIDYSALRRASLDFSDIAAGVPRMREMIAALATALSIPTQFVDTILFMECGYPEEKVYRSSMPRLGDGNKPFPNPSYPHPSEWAAGQKAYKAGAQQNKKSQIYIGITQISWSFWQDVRTHAPMVSNRIVLPEVWWQTSLFWQMAAPFIYFDRYKSKLPSTTLMVPAIVYAMHQQGPGGAQGRFTNIIGDQSSFTPRVIKAARGAIEGREVEVWI